MVFKRLFATAFFAFFVVSAAAAAQSAPALWVVQSGDAKVYLFGTVHVLRPTTVWHSPALDAALAESKQLWLEVPNLDDTAAATPIVQTFGINAYRPLSAQVPPKDIARIDQAAKSLGLPGESSMEPMQPWLVGILLSVVPLQKAGYDPKSGVDLHLKELFTTAGKPVHGFETLEQQMSFLANLPQAEQVAMLESTLDELDSAATTLDQLVTAWAAGDVDRFAGLTQQGMAAGSPDIYKTLIVNRNADWAQQLAAILKQPGVTFVAVGAAHLSGPDSLLANLQKLGYKVQRVQ